MLMLTFVSMTIGGLKLMLTYVCMTIGGGSFR